MFFVMLLAVSLGISASQFLILWVALEMSLLGFVGFMGSELKFWNVESSMKYFLIQSMASSLLLWAFLMSGLTSMEIYFNEIMTLTMMLKLGMPPFHVWVLNLAQALSWVTIFFFFTLQKILPLILLNSIKQELFLLFVILLSLTLSTLKSLNCFQLKKLLTLSSIFNFSWCLSVLPALELALTFLALYALNFFILVTLFSPGKSQTFFSLSLGLTPKVAKIFMIFFMLNLAGMPPFVSFFFKISVLTLLIGYGQILLSFSFLLFSVLMFYAYFRIFIYLSTNFVSPLFSQNLFLNSKYTLMGVCLLSSSLGFLVLLCMFENFDFSTLIKVKYMSK